MDLTIAIVSWNTRELLRRCLESVYTSTQGGSEPLRFEVVVVDNASSDGSADLVEHEFPHATLIRCEKNLGFAGANNLAIAISRGRHVLFLNSDAVLPPRGAEALVEFLDTHSDAGVVGVQLLNADGSFQGSFADFPSLTGELLLLTKLSKLLCPRTYPSYPPERSRVIRKVDWVFGACFAVRRRAIDQVGPLDEGFFMYSEETDWCYRLGAADWGVYYLPDVKVPHWSGQSASKAPERKRSQLYRSKSRFFHKHRHPFVARSFDLTLRLFSVLKYLAWTFGTLRSNPATREYARQQAHAYSVLLNELQW